MNGRLTKNTAYIHTFRYISLTAFDGQLMVLILHKESSTNSGHYIFMVKVGDIWFECDDVKITKIEVNNFSNSNTVYMLFYKRSAWWKHLRGIGLVPMDAACCSSWSPLSITYFHSLCFVCSGFTYEIYSGGGPITYVYCVGYYCMIVAPCVRSVGHVFTYL